MDSLLKEFTQAYSWTVWELLSEGCVFSSNVCHQFALNRNIRASDAKYLDSPLVVSCNMGQSFLLPQWTHPSPLFNQASVIDKFFMSLAAPMFF